MHILPASNGSCYKGSVLIAFLGLILQGCMVFKPSPKTAFVDGVYRMSNDTTKETVYVAIDGDSLNVYRYDSHTTRHGSLANVPAHVLLYEMQGAENGKTVFSKSGYDIDFITIPLKLRPAQSGVPLQLNANLNGAVYLGWRTDKYTIQYNNTPLHRSLRNMTHFGFSAGIYSGFGNTAVTPTNTNFAMDQEYDGLVWSKGLAAIIALNNFTVGLAIGFDNLLDKNHKLWLYESKPYLGFAFGLNLN